MILQLSFTRSFPFHKWTWHQADYIHPNTPAYTDTEDFYEEYLKGELSPFSFFKYIKEEFSFSTPASAIASSIFILISPFFSIVVYTYIYAILRQIRLHPEYHI